MSDKPSGPYIVVPYGINDESGTVYKVGPRGGRYYITRYWDIRTAQTIVNTLNVLHEVERP